MSKYLAYEAKKFTVWIIVFFNGTLYTFLVNLHQLNSGIAQSVQRLATDWTVR
jgi:hypothetical protein